MERRTVPAAFGRFNALSAVGSVSESVASNPSAVAPSRTRPFETAQTEFAASMLFVVSVDPTNAAFTAKFGTVHVEAAVGSVMPIVSSNASAVAPSKTSGLAPAIVPETVTISAAASPSVTAPFAVSAPVIAVAGVIVTAPVEVAPIPMVPEPFASMVRASFVPLETTERATPAAAAADLTLSPVADDAVEAST